MIDRSDSVSAERMRVDFVANASHELRTPLSTVLGYAETLAEEADIPDELRSTFGRTIRDDAKRMLRIIEDLMSLSRIEADRFVAPDESVEIDDVVRTSLANASHLRGSGQCDFTVDLAADLPRVRGDRAQLVQIARQSAQQRGPLRLRRTAFEDRDFRRPRRPLGRAGDRRPWPRHSARAFAAPDRALLPGRRGAKPGVRRDRVLAWRSSSISSSGTAERLRSTVPWASVRR